MLFLTVILTNAIHVAFCEKGSTAIKSVQPDQLPFLDDNYSSEWMDLVLQRKRRKDPTSSSPTALSGNSKTPTNDSHAPHEGMRGVIDNNPFGMQFVTDTDINDPVLKNYKMFHSPGDYFYPPWTYSGFYSPPVWHTVPIIYFMRSAKLQANASFDLANHKRHRSNMNLCSTSLTTMMEKHLGKDASCHEIYENECASVFPSPINIVRKDAIEDSSLNEFIFINHDNYYDFTIFFPEDGTDLLTLQLTTPKHAATKKPSVSSNSFTGKELFLDRVVFHVGENRFQGSEHTIDGKKFGMEIQFYFTSDDDITYWEALARYKAMGATGKEETGKKMLVLSVLVEVAKSGAKNPPVNAKFANVLAQISSVVENFWKFNNPGMYRAIKVSKNIFILEGFLGEPLKGIYYTYEGSLSHPPCLTGAAWTIFETPIWISYDSWLNFAMIHSEYSDHKTLAGNYRPQEHILIKADLKTYHEMREAMGMGPPGKKETQTTQPKHVMVHYKDFERYFSVKVKKSKHTNWKDKQSEYDYYETLFENFEESSAAKTVDVNTFVRITTIFVFMYNCYQRLQIYVL